MSRGYKGPMSGSLFWRRIAVSVIGFVAVIAAFGFVSEKLAAMRKQPGRAEAETRAIAVRVQKMERTTYKETLVGYGRARALRQTSVAAEVTGVVRWLSPRLEAGADLAKGEELVRLDDRDLKAALSSREARLRKTAAEERRLRTEKSTQETIRDITAEELETARRELARVKDLETRNAATRSEIDAQLLRVTLRRTAVRQQEGRISSLEAQRERVKAERAEVEASIRDASLQLGRSVIRAPYASRVTERNVRLGSRVAPGTVLFEIVDLSRIEIPVALAASRYHDVAIGATASVRLGDNTSWEGKVARVAPTVNTTDRTFFAYLVVEDAAGAAVPPGAFVTARIAGRRFDNVFALPRTAFVGDEIFVVRDNVAHAVTPAVRFTLPHVLLADGGLEAGAEVVVTNLEEIVDGSRVMPIRESPAGKDS